MWRSRRTQRIQARGHERVMADAKMRHRRKPFLTRRNEVALANRTKTQLAQQKAAFGSVFRPWRVRWLLQDLQLGAEDFQ